MSTEDEERRLLARMLPIQLGKLRANAHKKHWLLAAMSNYTVTPATRKKALAQFLGLLQEEVKELAEEVAKAPETETHLVGEWAVHNAGKIRSECADIMNVAAMIAHLAGDDSADFPMDAP